MYFVGGNLVISDMISIGTIAAFVVYVSQIYQPLTQLTNVRVDVHDRDRCRSSACSRCSTSRRSITERPGAVDLVEPVGRVEFDHVWFRHPSAAVSSIASLEGGVGGHRRRRRARWILRDVSFTIAPGELVALVGPSGAGKTTTALLVPAHPRRRSTGAVRVDGHDVRDLTLESLRGAVGMVMQDPHLFHDTIRANLRYARPDATDAELVEACRRRASTTMIACLPDGYDTVVGERGYRMSGGEKQRLAIARMLLKDPAVVILDEATSHLDSESELAIQHALADALVGRTVARDRAPALDHRRRRPDPRARRRPDRREGRHDELLAAGGLYTDLYQTQVDQPGATPADAVTSVGCRRLAPGYGNRVRRGATHERDGSATLRDRRARPAAWRRSS